MAVQPGLCGTWSETLKPGFLRTRLIYDKADKYLHWTTYTFFYQFVYCSEEEIKGAYFMIFDDNQGIILLIHKNLCCGCSLELPRRGDSNEHPHHWFL